MIHQGAFGQIVLFQRLHIQTLLWNTNSYACFYKQRVQMVTEGGTTLQCPIQHYNAWHDGTMPGTTLQCPVRCYNAQYKCYGGRYDVIMPNTMLQCAVQCYNADIGD